MNLDIRWNRFLLTYSTVFVAMFVGGAWMRGSDSLTKESEFWSGVGDVLAMLFTGASPWNIGIVICGTLMLIWVDKALEANLVGKKRAKMIFILIFFALLTLTVFVVVNLINVGLSEAALMFFGLPALAGLLFSVRKRSVSSTS